MRIKAELYSNARDDGTVEFYSREYKEPERDVLYEYKHIQSRSDTVDTVYRRLSYNDGVTFTPWEQVTDKDDASRVQGEHVLEYRNNSVYNHVHGHNVQIKNQFLHIDGYEAAMKKWWSGDTRARSVHFFISVSNDDKEQYSELVKYEEGADFDTENWVEPSYINNNLGYVVGANIIVEPNGDILLAAEVPMWKCCKILQKDINEIFPSRPYFPSGIMLLRGTWDGERYRFTHSRPIVISDVLSSRGLNEPTIAHLESGRIIMIIRGSNVIFNDGKCRINPGAPAVKWFTWSDDGGKTFTDLMPWHFDDGEIIYSAANISEIVKDERTGKHYWIGNMSDHTAYDNSPRYPLNIVEIDERYGTAKKDTLQIIDTKRDNEPRDVQLSNFYTLQNKTTGDLEIDLTKIGQFFDNSAPNTTYFKGEAWRYKITL